MDWILALIPAAVPLIISGVKRAVAAIPKVWLPVAAPLLGAALDIGLHYVGAVDLDPVLGAALGTAGIGVREILDQARKAMRNLRPGG